MSSGKKKKKNPLESTNEHMIKATQSQKTMEALLKRDLFPTRYASKKTIAERMTLLKQNSQVQPSKHSAVSLLWTFAALFSVTKAPCS